MFLLTVMLLYNQTHYVADPLNESDPEAHDEYNLKVSVPAGNKDNYITINNTNYYLSQFHFHWRSEHKINGQDGAGSASCTCVRFRENGGWCLDSTW